MSQQHVENLLLRHRNQAINIKTMSGGIYEGIVADVTNDYVALNVKSAAGDEDVVIVLLHSIESITPRAARPQ